MNLELPTILSSTLGLVSPWKITEVLFCKKEKRLDITVYCMDDKYYFCPTCGSKRSPCLTTMETWYHSSFLNYSTYLHARLPHVECCGEVVPVERPWSRKGSRFDLVC